MSGPKSKLKTRGDAVHGLRTGGLMLAGCLAGRAVAATVGAPVTIGAAADNSTIKMTFGSYSSDTTAAPLTPAGAVWAVAYVTPASDWSSSGAVNVTLQVFNPGATWLNETTDNERINGTPVFFNLQSTATTGSEPYAAVAKVTKSANLSSVTIPRVSPLSPLTFTSTDTATSFGNYKGSYSGTGGGGPGTFNHTATSSSEIKAPSHTAGAGDIMSWSITPNGTGASAGDKIYVSDFYKTSVGGVYAGFNLIGINGLSSWIGAKAGDIVYVTPEPGTWAAIIGLVGAVGWQVRSRRRSVAVERELSRNSN